MSITIEDIDKKLEELRNKWKNHMGDPRILERQAKLLKKAKAGLLKFSVDKQ